MIITLPFPPSVNAMFGGGSAQKRFPSKAYKAWMEKCAGIALHPFRSNSGRVAVVYTFYWPDARKRDLSNYVKAPEDLLIRQTVLEDDNWQIVQQVTLRNGGIDRTNPRVIVEIAPYMEG